MGLPDYRCFTSALIIDEFDPVDDEVGRRHSIHAGGQEQLKANLQLLDTDQGGRVVLRHLRKLDSRFIWGLIWVRIWFAELAGRSRPRPLFQSRRHGPVPGTCRTPRQNVPRLLVQSPKVESQDSAGSSLRRGPRFLRDAFPGTVVLGKRALRTVDVLLQRPVDQVKRARSDCVHPIRVHPE